MKTNNLTFAAMTAAISIAFMLIGTFVKTGTLAVYFILSLAVMITKSRCGVKSAILTYSVSAILAFILPVDIKISIMYALIFGIYPVLKAFAEAKPTVLQWIIKFICFNLELAGVYLLFRAFIPGMLLKSIPVMLLAANAALVVYDILLSYVHTVYVNNVDKFITRK